MLAGTIISFLLALASAHPAPAPTFAPPPTTSPLCAVPLVLLTSLPYEFVLQARSADDSISGKPVTFSPLSYSTYAAHFGTEGQVQNVTFQNTQLSIEDGKYVATLRVPRKTVWRQVVFDEKKGAESKGGKDAAELSVVGAYACDGKTGDSWIELSPGSAGGGDSGERLEFCAGKSLLDEHPVLAVKPVDEDDSTCTPVTLRVTEGIRPLTGESEPQVQPEATKTINPFPNGPSIAPTP